MTQLVLGLALFLGAHSVSIFFDGWRDRLVARIGSSAWRTIYSVVSLAGIALVVLGYAAARGEPLIVYTSAAWLRVVAFAILLPVFPLAFSVFLPGRIQAAAKHPLLVATKLWASAHLLVNGTLADIVLFGALLAWAIADRVAMKRRTPRAVTTLPPGRFNDWIAVGLGLGLYFGFFAGLHEWLTGMPIVPPW